MNINVEDTIFKLTSDQLKQSDYLQVLFDNKDNDNINVEKKDDIVTIDNIDPKIFQSIFNKEEFDEEVNAVKSFIGYKSSKVIKDEEGYVNLNIFTRKYNLDPFDAVYDFMKKIDDQFPNLDIQTRKLDYNFEHNGPKILSFEFDSKLKKMYTYSRYKRFKEFIPGNKQLGKFNRGYSAPKLFRHTKITMSNMESEAAKVIGIYFVTESATKRDHRDAISDGRTKPKGRVANTKDFIDYCNEVRKEHTYKINQ